MDEPGQLEMRVEWCVDQLIARMNAIKAENVRLKENEAFLKAENIKLASEYETLGVALRRERALRKEAYVRVNALLEKIRAYRGMP